MSTSRRRLKRKNRTNEPKIDSSPPHCTAKTRNCAMQRPSPPTLTFTYARPKYQRSVSPLPEYFNFHYLHPIKILYSLYIATLLRINNFNLQWKAALENVIWMNAYYGASEGETTLFSRFECRTPIAVIVLLQKRIFILDFGVCLNHV